MPKKRAGSPPAPLSLAVPAGLPSLAYSELGERLAGEGQRERFRVVESARTVAQSAYRKAVYVDRATGKFASKETWTRSRAQGGSRYVRHYRDVAAREAVVSRLPKAKPGTFDTLAAATAASPALKLGAVVAGKELEARLQALGLGPVRVRLQGFYQRTAGGPLERWEASAKAAGGLDRNALAGLLNAATRSWQAKHKSPPTILVQALTVEPEPPKGGRPGSAPEPAQRFTGEPEGLDEEDEEEEEE